MRLRGGEDVPKLIFLVFLNACFSLEICRRARKTLKILRFEGLPGSKKRS